MLSVKELKKKWKFQEKKEDFRTRVLKAKRKKILIVLCYSFDVVVAVGFFLT